MGFGSKSRAKRNPNATFAQKKPQKPRSLTEFWVAGGVLVTAAALAAFAAATWLGLAAERQAQRAHLEQLVVTLADAFADRKEGLRERLEEIAKDRRLRTAFEYADQADFDAEAERLKGLIPVALRLDLIRLESTPSGVRIIGEETLPLSYAGIDLVLQVAKSGLISRLEAHQVGQADQHLAIAGPVFGADGQTPLGVIHLALPLSLLPQPNASVAQQRHFLFQQGARSSMTTIAPKSAPLPGPDAITASAEVPDTGIRLLAWERPPALQESAWFWPNVIAAGGFFVLNVAILAILGTLQRARLAKEVEQLSLALSQADLGQPQSKRSIRSSELIPLDDGLRRLTRKRGFTAAGADPDPEMGFAEGEAGQADPTLNLDLDNPASQVIPPSETIPAQPDAGSRPRVDVTKVLGTIPARVFRPYDIRGLVGSEITDEFMRFLGQAIATESQEAGSNAVLVGRDHRQSGAQLTAALTEGLRASGCDVIDLGVVPTPVLYFATHLAGDISGAMVTASHNPSQYNGVKLVLSGKSATALNIAKLKQRLQRGEFLQGEGSYREQSVLADYFDEIEQNLTLARPLKIAVDCGYATPALVAPQMFRDLGCEVIEIRCDLEDERTGVEIPNPAAPENLRELTDAVLQHQADLGLGFDGDGDRLGVIDSKGQFIPTDRILMLLAGDLLSRNPGSDIVFDVKCSRLLAQQIKSLGGNPVMWKSGHAFIKEKREELKAPLAGEFSGHIVFGDRWTGFDDAFYAAARLLEVLAIDPRSSSELFAELPSALGTPELLVQVAPGQELEIMSQVMETKSRLSGVRVITIDGLRVETDKGWGLVRASNTEPALAFRFEATNESTLNKLKDLFRRVMESAAPNLELPF